MVPPFPAFITQAKRRSSEAKPIYCLILAKYRHRTKKGQSNFIAAKSRCSGGTIKSDSDDAFTSKQEKSVLVLMAYESRNTANRQFGNLARGAIIHSGLAEDH